MRENSSLTLAALGDFAAKDRQSQRRLAEEVRSGLDSVVARVSLPQACDAVVDRGRLGGGFDPQRVAMVVAVAIRRRAEVNDGVVASDLLRECGANRRPQVPRTGL